ncbi:SGNH/GDSL hydrolase family protein [Pectinatus sottacetonis]|uniref:SGNH/GDSL hydrolase family protein n=1 Tax=Pectinatus sottacetonis TaxID=1002795 RepID=UPI0018C55323|nr:GDSL-type esterase/lipase family protein [Pectinatus sottacetonis]
MLRILFVITVSISVFFSYITPLYAAPVNPYTIIKKGTVSHTKKFTLIWQPIPKAVQYEVTIIDKTTHASINDINHIYAAGYELSTNSLEYNLDNLYWRVRGLDFNGRPVNNFSEPLPLMADLNNSMRPFTTTQFNKMSYMPVYPVYSWIPYLNAAQYEIRIYKTALSPVYTNDTLIHEYHLHNNISFDFYDPAAYTSEGRYYWTIQAQDAVGFPVSRWSKPSYFTVTRSNIKVAALGDSITHGGGAISTPPSYPIYDWETYSPVPILNIGYSGDTTTAMLNRFHKDVLPFKPSILIIMGGINDIRIGTKASDVIANLTKIRTLCIKHNIIPVMVTVAPINPQKMQNINLTPSAGWQKQLLILNNWIRSFKTSIDVAPFLTDKAGQLKSTFTTDGLHPDKTGKCIIGKTIGTKLLQNYPTIVSNHFPN